MGDYEYLPFFTFGSFSTTNANSTIASLGSQRSDWGDGFDRPFNTFVVQPTLTAIWGGHTARAGYDFRYQRWKIISDGYPGGRFQFNGAYTRANNARGAERSRRSRGRSSSSGLPTTATGAVATPGTHVEPVRDRVAGRLPPGLPRLFVQDDWRVSPKLTLNLGLRLEINTGMTEAENRNLAGFDFATPNPIEARGAGRLRANPIPEIPVSAFHVNGGLLFADGPVERDRDQVPAARGRARTCWASARCCAAASGLFSYDYFFENINQAGFSQPTPVHRHDGQRG